MTSLPAFPSILPSAQRKFSEEDILAALGHPRGIARNFPRKGVRAIGGFTAKAVPIVVLMDMESDVVFHAQKLERKYHRLFR